MKPIPNSPEARGCKRPPVVTALLGLLLVLSGPGCSIVRNTASVPERTVRVFFPGGKQNQPDPGDLQQGLMRLADSYIAETSQSVDDLAGGPHSPFTIRGALELKLATATAGTTVATRDNPYAGLLDMVSLTTLTHMSLVHHRATMTNGAILDTWIRRSGHVESNAWALADQVLSVEQQASLRQSIQEYFTTKIEPSQSFLLEPVRMASALPHTLQTQQGNAPLFDLSAIDPFAGLDPAVREVTETRLFAERAMYMVQRMPWLLRGQVELMLLDATSQPKVAKALEDASQLTLSIDRASKAAESISATAEGLPEQISQEREALVQALKDQEQPMTDLLTAATALSDSLSGTVTNTDALMKRFGVGEPKPPGETEPSKTNSKPFDILEYAETAEKATALARELDALVSNLNATIDSPALERVSNQATADARRLLNHAFLLGAGLVVLILASALLYRLLTRRQLK